MSRSVGAVDLLTHRSSKSKPTLGSTVTRRLRRLPSTVGSGGRYDPSTVKRLDDDDDEYDVHTINFTQSRVNTDHRELFLFHKILHCAL